jgi:hypothetical protein
MLGHPFLSMAKDLSDRKYPCAIAYLADYYHSQNMTEMALEHHSTAAWVHHYGDSMLYVARHHRERNNEWEMLYYYQMARGDGWTTASVELGDYYAASNYGKMSRYYQEAIDRGDNRGVSHWIEFFLSKMTDRSYLYRLRKNIRRDLESLAQHLYQRWYSLGSIRLYERVSDSVMSHPGIALHQGRLLYNCSLLLLASQPIMDEPGREDRLLNLAECHRQNGETDRTDLYEILARDYGNSEAMKQLYLIYRWTDRHSRALELLDNASRNDTEAMFLRANEFVRDGLEQSALEIYKRASDRGHANSMFNLGVLHARSIASQGGCHLDLLSGGNRPAGWHRFQEAVKYFDMAHREGVSEGYQARVRLEGECQGYITA